MNVLIFLGGEKPSKNLSRIAADRASMIIAADSGYDAISSSSIRPDVVTGDFDSILQIPESREFEVIPAPEQDATDFQKALRHLPPETRLLEILGGTGLRSDHFLTNLLIAAGLPSSLSVVFHDDTQSIYRITGALAFSMQLKLQTVVSLIPFTECSGVTTSGLRWNLKNSQMGPSSQLGQSNRVDEEAVSIQLKEGTLYAVVNHPNGLD
jgi:thiamine pyrophosphokinase